MRMFRYEKVRELEIAFMRSHYSQLGDALSTITDRLVQGEFPYAAEVLKTLLDLKNDSNTGSKGRGSSTSTSLEAASRPGRQLSFLSPGSGRRTHSRGNVAPPPFRTNYHALFSPPQPGANATVAPLMSTSTSGGASSTSPNNPSATPVWSTYSFAVDNDDDDV